MSSFRHHDHHPISRTLIGIRRVALAHRIYLQYASLRPNEDTPTSAFWMIWPRGEKPSGARGWLRLARRKIASSAGRLIIRISRSCSRPQHMANLPACVYASIAKILLLGNQRTMRHWFPGELNQGCLFWRNPQPGPSAIRQIQCQIPAREAMHVRRTFKGLHPAQLGWEYKSRTKRDSDPSACSLKSLSGAGNLETRCRSFIPLQAYNLLTGLFSGHLPIHSKRSVQDVL